MTYNVLSGTLNLYTTQSINQSWIYIAHKTQSL